MNSMMSVTLIVILIFSILSPSTQLDIILYPLKGVLSYTLSHYNDSLKWIISAPLIYGVIRVEIVFQSINIDMAELVIYEKSTQNQLFYCNACGNLLPPPLFSSTSEVVIFISGYLSTANYFQSSSFSLQYVSQSSIEVKELNIVKLDLLMGTATIKPMLINDKFVVANSSQIWNISVAKNLLLTFSFSSLLFQYPCSTSLSIFDNFNDLTSPIFSLNCSMLSNISYVTKKWFYSTTGSAYVLLQNDLLHSFIDFELTYFSDLNLFQCGSIMYPRIMRDQSFILTDGSSSSSSIKRNMRCSWLIDPIAPLSNRTITVFVSRLSLRPGATISVYDGSTSSFNSLLWTSSDCIYPPPIISQSTSMLVTFYSADIVFDNFHGFQVEYQVNDNGSVGVGNQTSIIKSALAFDIHPPGLSSSYIWYVQPDGLLSNNLLVVFHEFELEDDDILTLYSGYDFSSGKVVASWSGANSNVFNQLNWYLCSAPLIFEFIPSSKSLRTSRGFKISYVGDGDNYKCGIINLDKSQKLEAYSMQLTDGSSSSHEVLSNQYCRWVIHPKNVSSLVVFFNRLDLINGLLTLYNGSIDGDVIFNISQVTFGAIPTPISIKSDEVVLTYTTSDSSRGLGFSLTYYSKSDHIAEINRPGDGVISIMSSSTAQLDISLVTNVSWVITPISSIGSIYISFNRFHISSRIFGEVSLYDGITQSSPLIHQISLADIDDLNVSSYLPVKWIKTTSTKLLISISTNNTKANVNSLEVSYFSDGPNYHCYGSDRDEQVYSAISMMFSDGSPSKLPMYPNQICQWLIQPKTSSTQSLIVLEFLRNDMIGGVLEIYENKSSIPLWTCIGCNIVPRRLISSSGYFLIKFKTFNNQDTYGLGFQLFYWLMDLENYTSQYHLMTNQHVQGYLLESNGVTDAGEFNTIVSENPTSLDLSSSFISHTLLHPNVSSNSIDGRSNSMLTDGLDTSLFYQSEIEHCGILQTAPNQTTFTSTSITSTYFQPSAFYLTYVKKSSMTKTLESKAFVSLSLSNQTHSSEIDSLSIIPNKRCQYQLNSYSSLKPIDIFFSYPQDQDQDNRLMIYTGSSSMEFLAFDSHYDLRPFNVSEQQYHVIAPCGIAIVVLETNPRNITLAMRFQLNNATDRVNYCENYLASLVHQTPWLTNAIRFYLILGSIGLIIFLILFSMITYIRWIGYPKFLRSLIRQFIIFFCQRRPSKSLFLAIRLRFLPIDTCCICHENTNVVSLSLGSLLLKNKQCIHKICIEDLKNYLVIALGDISMFPIKCPMHCNGCLGTINSNVAKLVLTTTQLDKFLLFQDRVVLGNGMRCITCRTYIVFPLNININTTNTNTNTNTITNGNGSGIGNGNGNGNGNTNTNTNTSSVIICSFCSEKMCVKCNALWHYGLPCPLDTFDDSIQQWSEKASTHVQACPICKQLIQKSDIETCHHMIHKITDAIPCIQNRVDYCYLCGIQVEPNYPHYEINTIRGSNRIDHFPCGVFQKCRIILQRERNQEIENYRKLRQRNQFSPIRRSHVATIGFHVDNNIPNEMNISPRSSRFRNNVIVPMNELENMILPTNQLTIEEVLDPINPFVLMDNMWDEVNEPIV